MQSFVVSGAPAVRHVFSILIFRASNSISKVEQIMDVHVMHGLKKMSVEDFSHLLSTLEEGIGGSGLRADRRERLIHLGQVMLHDAPQGRFAPRSKVSILPTIHHNRHAQGHSALCDAML